MNKKIGAIILARLDSARLPGKALLEVLGRPLIKYTIERVQAANCFQCITLATSDRPIDDRLAVYAHQIGLDIFRGSVSNVARRVLACAKHNEMTAFARVNGDSPLVDPQSLALAVAHFEECGADVVTNIYPRTFPKGASVEIIDTNAMERACSLMKCNDHFEHVTKFFYDNPAPFQIENMRSDDPELADLSLAVDTPSDLKRISQVLRFMQGDHLEFQGQKLYELCKSGVWEA